MSTVVLLIAAPSRAPLAAERSRLLAYLAESDLPGFEVMDDHSYAMAWAIRVHVDSREEIDHFLLEYEPLHSSTKILAYRNLPTTQDLRLRSGYAQLAQEVRS